MWDYIRGVYPNCIVEPLSHMIIQIGLLHQSIWHHQRSKLRYARTKRSLSKHQSQFVADTKSSTTKNGHGPRDHRAAAYLKL